MFLLAVDSKRLLNRCRSIKSARFKPTWMFLIHLLVNRLFTKYPSIVYKTREWRRYCNRFTWRNLYPTAVIQRLVSECVHISVDKRTQLSRCRRERMRRTRALLQIGDIRVRRWEPPSLFDSPQLRSWRRGTPRLISGWARAKSGTRG